MGKGKVTKVIDGDTFEIEKGWKWGENRGKLVRPTGYNTPEKGKTGYEEAKNKLTKLILGKIIEIDKAETIDHGRLVCPVVFSSQTASAIVAADGGVPAPS